MPNWCSNYIRINGDAKTISIIKSACERCAEKDEPIFRNLIDIPSYMTNEQYEKDWYDTNVGWFGTKWDVHYNSCGFVYEDTEIVMCPETAWSPPIAFLENLVKQYKGIEAYIFYSEPGVGFSGETNIYRDEDGQVIVDDNEFPYLEGIHKVDKEMFWSEVEGYCDSFKDEHQEYDEDNKPLPIPDEKINEYISDILHFVEDDERNEIFEQFKEYVK